jgi:urocanate hydratase
MLMIWHRFLPIRSQVADNQHEFAAHRTSSVGSKRAFFIQTKGRKAIALAFNRAIANGELKGPVVLAAIITMFPAPTRHIAKPNIMTVSNLTADMAILMLSATHRGALGKQHNGEGRVG